MAKVSHIGICVADIERALVFYRDGLGFAMGERVLLTSDQVKPLLGLSAAVYLDASCQFIRLGAVALELIQFRSPPAAHSEIPRPINKFGFTHISLRVADVDATAANLELHGGRVLGSTRVRLDLGENLQGEVVFCTDPDGNRVELMSFPEAVQFY